MIKKKNPDATEKEQIEMLTNLYAEWQLDENLHRLPTGVVWAVLHLPEKQFLIERLIDLLPVRRTTIQKAIKKSLLG
jgi:hypothetical protein